MRTETTTLASHIGQQNHLRYSHKKFILAESDCITAILDGLPEHYFRFCLVTDDLTKERSLQMLAPFRHTHFEISTKTKVNCLAVDSEFLYALVGDHREQLMEYFNSSQGHHPAYQRQLWALNTLFHQALRPEINHPLTRIYIESKVIEIVARITFLTENDFTNQPQSKNPLFDSIKNFLDDHLMEEHSLSSLAKKFGVNEFKLKKGFKEAHGMPVFKYLLERRMEYANQLLKDQRLYVGEVATRIGYKNSNHFSTAFKKKFGFSPRVLKAA